jgi:DNA-binding transcriptional MerR regulator
MVKEQYLINEAAKEVHVETHVLRYWEDELNLPIGRNEQGHRIYTQDDIERFIRIKDLKDQGLQLKAVRSVIDGDNKGSAKEIRIVPMKGQEEQSRRIQYLFQKLIREAVATNNEELTEILTKRISDSIKQDVAKELDYQLRLSEERLEVRQSGHDEEHYRQIDTLLRKYSIKGTKDKTINFPSAKQDIKENTKENKKAVRFFKKNKTKKNAAP